MAIVKPFRPYRYTAEAGDPAKLVTQPYDKINPAMQAKYLAASPHNLVRIILGERFPADDNENNVYTRAAAYLNEWSTCGILAQDPAPAFYAYSQEFTVPDTYERATRQGFVGIGRVEEYSEEVVYRHEQTLSGPKKDRLELLRHAKAHFGHIFMLYPDREAAIDAILTEASQGEPALDVVDDYDVRNRLWPITSPEVTARIEALMLPKKLLIADGHHRYETALAYSKENPDPAARFVMMTFVNMYSPGLRILATHRVLRNLPLYDEQQLLKRAFDQWKVATYTTTRELREAMQAPDPKHVRIGMVTTSGDHILSRPRKHGELDVPVLHNEVLTGLLNVTEDAVRDEAYITYVRGIDAAAAEVREKGAQVAFLLEPTPIDEMARIAFEGGVMPQKSTDFFPKLLSGVTIYRL
ncbi:MAG: DUF1015 domain-containing protein [Acidobacteriota bacterium]